MLKNYACHEILVPENQTFSLLTWELASDHDAKFSFKNLVPNFLDLVLNFEKVISVHLPQTKIKICSKDELENRFNDTFLKE